MHVGARHAAHTGELCHGCVGGVHLWVATHGVDGVGRGVRISSGGRWVNVAHHAVACRNDW